MIRSCIRPASRFDPPVGINGRRSLMIPVLLLAGAQILGCSSGLPADAADLRSKSCCDGAPQRNDLAPRVCSPRFEQSDGMTFGASWGCHVAIDAQTASLLVGGFNLASDSENMSIIARVPLKPGLYHAMDDAGGIPTGWRVTLKARNYTSSLFPADGTLRLDWVNETGIPGPFAAGALSGTLPADEADLGDKSLLRVFVEF